MGIRIMLWFMGLKCLGVLFFLIGSFVYRPPPSETKEVDIKFEENIRTITGTMADKNQTDNFTKL